MNLQRIKKIIFEPGFLLTTLFAFSCLLFFFGKLLEHPNQTYFGAGGDGFQAYYNAIYHVKYDVSYWQFNGMNYPYGEQVFFTGCQPLVTNILKLFHIVNYTVGIINIIMLFSIVLSALFLYFIFKHLHLPYLYAAIAATAIAFLSPQIDRLGGHYSLTYQFSIPLFLLLLLKFYKSPTLKKSFIIALLIFFMAGTHFYFYGLFAIISVFYFVVLFCCKEGQFSNLKFTLKHFFIQLIFPFILIQILILLIDRVDDRTHLPYGYFEYISNMAGVFFTQGRLYSPVFEFLFKPNYPEWEGWAYIGIVSVIVSIFLLLFPLWVFYKRQQSVFLANDNKIIIAFLTAAIVASLLAFGYPFTIKHFEFLFDYAGPLKQLRGIGRFTWIFYYVINIIAFYMIANWASKQKIVLKFIIMSLPLVLVCYDAYTMSRGKQDNWNNRITRLEDKKNELKEDQWINAIDTKDYQALIMLPYLHIGSENIWINKESEITKDVFIASIKTGLPIVNVFLSRTSLSQTYKNIQLIKEPYRKLEIIADFKNTKPFLVFVRENELNEDEKKFLTNCKKIKQTPEFSIYEIQVDTLKNLSTNLYLTAKNILDKSKTYVVDGFNYTDSIKTFFYNEYEENLNPHSYEGKGCYEGKIKEYNVIYKGTLPNYKDKNYTLSFWMDDFTADVYPRTLVELAFADSIGKVYGSDYFNPGNAFCVINGNWALIERKFKLKNKSDILTITLWCDKITDAKKLLRIDNLLIKPEGAMFYKNISDQHITVNNRTYFKE
ncbi:MAG: hypothetical protein ABI315_14095 [Bacteroidia bacterium]